MNRKQTNRHGTATVEFALVAPVVLFIFLGAIEMANMNFIRNMANDAAFQVARKAIIPGADLEQAIADSKTLLKHAGIRNVEITPTTTVETVTVNVSIPVDKNSWTIGRFISGQQIKQSCLLTKQVKGYQ